MGRNPLPSRWLEVAWGWLGMASPGSAGGCPPAPPQTRTSAIHAYGSSESWFRCIDRVNHPGFGKVKELQQLVHPLPGHPFGIAPARQPFPPDLNHFPTKPLQGFKVARDAVIPKVTFELTTQLLHLLPQRFVPVFATPLTDRFETAREPFAHGLAPDQPIVPSGSCPSNG